MEMTVARSSSIFQVILSSCCSSYRNRKAKESKCALKTPNNSSGKSIFIVDTDHSFCVTKKTNIIVKDYKCISSCYDRVLSAATLIKPASNDRPSRLNSASDSVCLSVPCNDSRNCLCSIESTIRRLSFWTRCCPP
jgi:hypothetical protein